MSTAAPPRERPILFSSPMIRALLAGRKTQTRRTVKPQPVPTPFGFSFPGKGIKARQPNRHILLDNMHDQRWIHDCCPYGDVGDTLWVREKFYVAEPYSWGTDPSGEAIVHEGVPRGPVHYAADGFPENTPNRHYPNGLRGGAISAPDPYAVWIHRPSIHMPRWASRITLEITGVRVERLNEISEADCLAEGIFDGAYDPGLDKGGKPGWCYGPDRYAGTPRHAYELLWESIHGPGSWAANPWVWCLSFSKLEPCS